MRLLAIALLFVLAACAADSSGPRDEHAEKCHHSIPGCAYTN